MNKILFSEKMKLADLISANHYLILMLPRFGIPLGFGDKRVMEVCAKYNVPADFFLLICNVYSYNSYIPDEKDVVATDMRLLIPYLMASHKYYLNERLPHIEQHLNRIADDVDGKYGSVLKRFFAGYKNEVSEHFMYEEETVFPYIEALASGRPAQGRYRIRDFEEAHNDIEDKLNDLMQIIFKYLPGNVSQRDSISVVFDIFELSSDLNKHSLIEEKVLVPYVKLIEKKII
ncbi:MAG: hemerythrin domain-containing protein [Tannerella sp.]|jgi:regulator of cell morphogenesis and NO signaling|nr:hemerythrin domain-containing protein [Tannerella sp.]